MGVRVAFLPDCLLILFLLKHKGIEAFLNQIKKNSKHGKLLK